MILEIRDYPRNLEMLANNRDMNKFFESGSRELLINRARNLRTTLNRRGGTWKFSIPRNRPLTFRKNDSNLQIDVSCEIEGADNAIKKQNIVLRIWSFDRDICYRDGVDHPDIENKLENSGGKRVMLRFHFDLRTTQTRQLEPLYHLQVGGTNPEDDENWWLPEQIKVPRFPYPPMDIILLCEFILMNFFHEDYERIRKKSEWINLVRKSQEFFQKCYFEKCVSYLNDSRDTLIGNLVTPLGEHNV